MHNYQIYLAAVLFGLCIGSFLNVCIYRIPDESKSINHPSRSICLNCGYTLKFYDNIPILSYIQLKGRCRQCQAPISWRYPLVELLTGLGALCVFLKSGLSLATLIYFIFIACLLVITFIDLDHRIIPDVITLPGIPIFFVMALAVPDVTLKDSLIGLLIGGGSLWAVAYIYKLLTDKDGMGGRRYKIIGNDGCSDRVARRLVYNFCIFRNRLCHRPFANAYSKRQSEVGRSIRPFSGYRSYFLYLFRPANDLLVF